MTREVVVKDSEGVEAVPETDRFSCFYGVLLSLQLQLIYTSDSG